MKNKTAKNNAAGRVNCKNRKQAKRWFMAVVRPKIRANRAACPQMADLWPDRTFSEWHLFKYKAGRT